MSAFSLSNSSCSCCFCCSLVVVVKKLVLARKFCTYLESTCISILLVAAADDDGRLIEDDLDDDEYFCSPPPHVSDCELGFLSKCRDLSLVSDDEKLVPPLLENIHGLLFVFFGGDGNDGAAPDPNCKLEGGCCFLV